MKKLLAILLAVLMLLSLLTACGKQDEVVSFDNDNKNDGQNTDKPQGGEEDQYDDDKDLDPGMPHVGIKGTIRLWVGEASAEFYQKICNEYVERHRNFCYSVEVTGMDTGTVAGTITADPQAAADIYTVYHDSIGKLVAEGCAKPITDDKLTAQVTADAPKSFRNVIYVDLNGKSYLFGVPYISQALFLYYNKALVTEEQARSFEGLREAARAAGTKAVTVTGDDGFNMSFALLATKVSDHSTTMKLYEGASAEADGSKGVCNCQGDDTVAIFRWLQAYAADPNGFKWPSSDGWAADLDMYNMGVLAVIGGAWKFKEAQAVLGEANLGIAMIPTFTLTEESVEGLTDVKAGDVYRGGTFADCKCFMINANSDPEKFAYEQKLIKYLSNREVQNDSYLICHNVPAYVGAADFIRQCYEENKVTESEYKLAAVQVGMAEWGIPQPFVTSKLNLYYYSKMAPSVFRALIDRSPYPTTGGDIIISETESLDGVRKALYLIEYIWTHGKTTKDFPASLPTPAAEG